MANEMVLILTLPAAQDNLLALKSSHNAVPEVDRVRVKEGRDSRMTGVLLPCPTSKARV